MNVSMTRPVALSTRLPQPMLQAPRFARLDPEGPPQTPEQESAQIRGMIRNVVLGFGLLVGVGASVVGLHSLFKPAVKPLPGVTVPAVTAPAEAPAVKTTEVKASRFDFQIRVDLPPHLLPGIKDRPEDVLNQASLEVKQVRATAADGKVYILEGLSEADEQMLLKQKGSATHTFQGELSTDEKVYDYDKQLKAPVLNVLSFIPGEVEPAAK